MLRVRRPNVNNVSANPEGASREIEVVAVVLNIDKVVDEVVALQGNLAINVGSQPRIVLGTTNTVNARHRCHDDNIAARQEHGGRLMPELLDLLVDRSVFLDIRIGLRNIGFGLVVVVVRDKIDDAVVGKKLLELACELSCERLVGGHNQRRLANRLDGLCHGVGLAGARHAKKHLVAISPVDALGKRCNGLRLIARRLIGRNNFKLYRVTVDTKAPQSAANARDRFRHRSSFIRSEHLYLSIRGHEQGASYEELRLNLESIAVKLLVALLSVLNAHQIRLGLRVGDGIMQRSALIRPIVDIGETRVVSRNSPVNIAIEIRKQVTQIRRAKLDVHLGIGEIVYRIVGPVDEAFQDHIGSRVRHKLHEANRATVRLRALIPS